jgi:hypothetical protein
MMKMSRRTAVAAVLVCALFTGIVDAKVYYATMQGETTVDVRAVAAGQSPPHDATAVADYNATLSTTGWDVINLESNGAASDQDQAYAAGYLNGYLTSARMWLSWQNNYGLTSNGKVNPEPIAPQIAAFFEKNMAWMESNIEKNRKTDPYWNQAGLMWTMWQGTLAGANANAKKGQTFTKNMLMMLTALGDLGDLNPGLNVTMNGLDSWRQMSKQRFDTWVMKSTHCSSLFKVLPDNSDIFFGHTTWFQYNTMVRLYQIITLNFNAEGTESKTVSFSSYPGALSSIDDYYITDSGLAVTETSLIVYNLTMYKDLSPETMLYWVRVALANRMATSSKDWTDIFARYNSGTYNNQWMVFDLKQFTPGQDLKPGSFYILEQFPGMIAVRDETATLSYGYWPSYNVPSVKELFEISGQGEALKQQGPEMTDYELCVRAQIFRRDQTNVKDLATYQYIMQYNNYEVDPISQKNPGYAISARGDLIDTMHGGGCWGGLDAKVSSYKLWKDGMKTMAFSGPSPQQPTFVFDTYSNPNNFGCTPSGSLPNVWNFTWQTMRP